jgi:hypothetical protein
MALTGGPHLSPGGREKREAVGRWWLMGWLREVGRCGKKGKKEWVGYWARKKGKEGLGCCFFLLNPLLIKSFKVFFKKNF